MSTAVATLEDLPTEVLAEIVSHLDHVDVVCLCRVSTHLHDLVCALPGHNELGLVDTIAHAIQTYGDDKGSVLCPGDLCLAFPEPVARLMLRKPGRWNLDPASFCEASARCVLAAQFILRGELWFDGDLARCLRKHKDMSLLFLAEERGHKLRWWPQDAVSLLMESKEAQAEMLMHRMGWGWDSLRLTTTDCHDLSEVPLERLRHLAEDLNLEWSQDAGHKLSVAHGLDGFLLGHRTGFAVNAGPGLAAAKTNSVALLVASLELGYPLPIHIARLCLSYGSMDVLDELIRRACVDPLGLTADACRSGRLETVLAAMRVDPQPEIPRKYRKWFAQAMEARRASANTIEPDSLQSVKETASE